jgi:acetylornithine deacetylase
MNSIDYLKELVAFPSVSATSNVEVTDHIEQHLMRLGFETERVDYEDKNGVLKSNVIAQRGSGSGGFAYFAHSDVVPADDWNHSDAGPWEPVITNDRLYARGSCDMKGSLACMLAAAEEHASRDLVHPLYITVTADEEVGYVGALEVAKRSRLFQEMVDGNANGVIGEPTELQVVYAHKGSLAIKATSRGLAAHSSQAHGVNANLKMIPFLAEMKAIHDDVTGNPEWENTEFDPPGISWNIGVNDHTHAINITPPQSVCTVYFRPMPGIEPEPLINRARAAAEANGLEFEVMFRGEPLYVPPGSDFVREVLQIADQSEAYSVCYGTDASAFTTLKNLVVFGPGSIEQAHMADEFILLQQLEKGVEAYGRLIRKWCL